MTNLHIELDKEAAIVEAQKSFEQWDPSRLIDTPDDSNEFTAPPDRFGLAWICCCLLGVGLLFPFNCYIAAGDYFDSLYPTAHYSFLMSLAYNFFSWILLFVSLKLMPKVSFNIRINSFILAGAGILFFMPFIPLIITDNQTGAVSFSLVLTFFSGSFSSLLFGSVMGLVALFPASYTGAVMSGCGVAGIIASLLRIITKVSMPSTESGLKKSSFLYFFLGGGILLMCFFAYQTLIRLKISLHYMRAYNNSNTRDGSINGGEKKQVSILKLLPKVWREAFVVFTVFFTTLSLFPGVTSLIDNINSSLSDDWFNIIFVLFFMVGDLIGRTVPKWFILFTPNNLWIPTILRLVFFPLFALCVKPLIFRNIFIYFAFMFVFSITNGYCGTLAMMFGPSKAEEHERETTGIVMSFFLNFGIWVATLFAFLLSYLLTGSSGISF